MNKFSVFDYGNLSAEDKAAFNKVLARKISPFIGEIKDDDVLGSSSLSEFVASTGMCANSTTFVPDIYYKISSGIQAGSGNQNLFLGILNAFVEALDDIIKKQQ